MWFEALFVQFWIFFELFVQFPENPFIFYLFAVAYSSV